MKDKSNFYNLTSAEQDIELENLWDNTLPGAKEFADDLKKILTKIEYPYVIGLNGKYGMGKTYFSSRFSAYLNKDINTMSIYFSAWEHDIYSNPFLAFSKVILEHIKTTKKDILKKITECFKKIAKATSFSIPFAPIDVNIDIGRLIDEFSKGENHISEFKLELTNILNEIKIKKLIVIVDELDRCRPDYAIKVLETIKHFFDINKIIFLLPINIETLVKAVSAVYGFSDDASAEYLGKFFNHHIYLPSPDYTKFITSILNDKLFEKEIQAGYLNVPNKPYTNLESLQKCLVSYASEIKPSLRELNNILNLVELFVKNKKERVRCEILSYCIFSNFIKQTNVKHNVYKCLSESTIKKDNYFERSWTMYKNTWIGVNENLHRYHFSKEKEQELKKFYLKIEQARTYEDVLQHVNNTRSIKEIMRDYSSSLLPYINDIITYIENGLNKNGLFELTDIAFTTPKLDEYMNFVANFKLN